jgi:hypothetical protein
MKTIHLHRFLRPHLQLHLSFEIYNLIINKTYYNMKRIYNSQSYTWNLETFQ